MKSYILAIAAAMFVSAVYVFQNTGDVTIRFLFFEGNYQQGVWDVILFSVGVLLMWVFSIFSSFETRSKYRTQIKELDKKIAALEEEKNSLLEAFKRINPPAELAGLVPVPETAAKGESVPAAADDNKETVSD